MDTDAKSAGRSGRRGRERAGADPRKTTPDRRGPAFWLELYWFVFILILGCTLALAVLPPKILALRESLALEARCRDRLRQLNEKELSLRKELAALERGEDPFYREEAIRRTFGAKSVEEEFAPPPRGGR